MPDRTVSTDTMSIGSKDALTEILRQGAQQMLARAIENEVAEYLEQHGDQCDERGRRMVVRNGYRPARDIQTGVGLVEVRQPRVRDKRCDEQGERLRFTSRILPPYLRGISTGDFTEALQALLGPRPRASRPPTSSG